MPPNSPEYTKSRQHLLLEAGLCVVCGKSPHEPNRKKCVGCLESQRSYQKSWRDGKITNGLCGECGKNPTLPDKYYCEGCRILHTEKVKTYYRAPGGKEKTQARNRALRLQVFEAYGGAKCACCGETEYVFLTLDHVLNDGAKHRREIGANGLGVYYWLRDNAFPSGFQVLCWNCNLAKRILGVCPHQKIERTSET